MKTNYVRITGNVGSTPSIKTFKESEVMNLSVATNDKYTSKAGKEVKETVWHNVVAWSNQKMIDFKEIQKGTRITVEGKIRPVNYTTKTGTEKQGYEILASSIILG